MFLGESDIRKRLAEGDLVIDPLPDERQFGSFTVDLRLGAQFVRLPLTKQGSVIDAVRPEDAVSKTIARETAELGSRLEVPPGAMVLGLSLEYVHFPVGLAGFLFPRASFQRIGISVATATTVHPGFQGKLTFEVQNTNTVPIILHPGQRIIHLCFAEVTGSSSRDLGTTGQDYKLPPLGASEEAEIKAVAARLRRDVLVNKMPDVPLKERLAAVLSADAKAKGKLLERLVEDIFSSVAGLQVLRRNARLWAEEIDLILKNNLTTGFWRVAGSPIIVECKNWSGKVGASEISVLIEKLRALSPDAKAGILVAPNGITGDSYRDAVLKIREARQHGRYILVFDRSDLEDLVGDVSLDEMIEKKYNETMLI